MLTQRCCSLIDLLAGVEKLQHNLRVSKRMTTLKRAYSRVGTADLLRFGKVPSSKGENGWRFVTHFRCSCCRRDKRSAMHKNTFATSTLDGFSQRWKTRRQQAVVYLKCRQLNQILPLFSEKQVIEVKQYFSFFS